MRRAVTSPGSCLRCAAIVAGGCGHKAIEGWYAAVAAPNPPLQIRGHEKVCSGQIDFVVVDVRS